MSLISTEETNEEGACDENSGNENSCLKNTDEARKIRASIVSGFGEIQELKDIT